MSELQMQKTGFYNEIGGKNSKDNGKNLQELYPKPQKIADH